MQPFVQKLPLQQDTSFVARTYRTPHFEVGWHQHIEFELILFTEGAGISFVGNYIGEFQTGDIFFLGSNLPHTFQKRAPDLMTSAIVIQFNGEFWGEVFLQLPECSSLDGLFAASKRGLRINDPVKTELSSLIRQLEHAEGFKRLLLLGECLDLIARGKKYTMVSTVDTRAYPSQDQATIDRVFRFTLDNFREPIGLTEAAAVANMSHSRFCTYFKRRTQKTYIHFLNEVRIGHACHQLRMTDDSVCDISYDSGYTTLAHFHEQFLRLNRMTPLQYRKRFSEQS